MKMLFLISSGQLSYEQQQDARDNLEIDTFITLPEEFQEFFDDIPPDLEKLNEHLKPITDWMDEHCAHQENYLFIQGEDLGAVHYLVQYCKLRKYARPIYAATEGKMRKHKRFRLF